MKKKKFQLSKAMLKHCLAWCIKITKTIPEIKLSKNYINIKQTHLQNKQTTKSLKLTKFKMKMENTKIKQFNNLNDPPPPP